MTKKELLEKAAELNITSITAENTNAEIEAAITNAEIEAEKIKKPKKDYKIVVSSPENDDATGFSVDVNGRNVTLQYDEEEEVTADVYHALKDAVKVGVKKVKQTNDEGKVEWVQQPITIPRYTMVGQKI